VLAKTRYERSQAALAQFDDRNRSLDKATAQIPRDRLQREYEVAFNIFQQLSLEVEQARIKKSQDTPVFSVIQEASVPHRRSSPLRGAIILLSAMLGALGAGAWIITKHPELSATR
jgi:uncharacterized protein involved in exopolysaccharide biosynthesis